MVTPSWSLQAGATPAQRILCPLRLERGLRTLLCVGGRNEEPPLWVSMKRVIQFPVC